MSYIRNENFVKAVKFIDKNIDAALTLEKIARHIGISVTSLKRLFSDAINQTPGAFIRRIRMEFALRSLQDREDSVLEIALASGFEDHAAFSRSFKETFGYSPSNAREKLNIVSELEHITLKEPDFVILQNIELQCITETGLYFEAAPLAWQKLKEKLTVELNDDFPGLFVGIGHDNPHEAGVKEDQVRFSAGIAFSDNDLNINRILIPEGSYARFHYYGKPNNLGLAYHYIYGTWQDSANVKINKDRFAFQLFDHFPSSFGTHDVLIHIPII